MTPEGRRLTDAHRRAQIMIGADTTLIIAALWNAYGDTPYFLDLAVAVIMAETGRSSALALQYLRQWRRLELDDVITEDTAEVPFRADRNAVRSSMWFAGPALVTALVGVGVAREYAQTRALRSVVRRANRIVLEGGRSTIMESALASGRGFHRVTSARPCAFCAAMSMRDPVIRSRSALPEANRWHAHCGCGVTEVAGEFEPTAREAAMSDVINGIDHGQSESDLLAELRRTGTVSDAVTDQEVS